MGERFRVHFFGTFSVIAPGGQDIAPKGAKAKALLALLAEAENMRRGRRWLEARLWSDRGQEQASGSLRQTLMTIRSALGEHASLLGSDRNDVWLDAKRVETDLESPAANSGREVLEGLDVRDDAFEDWLRELRSRLDAPAKQQRGLERPTSRGITIRAVMSDDGAISERITGRIVADQVAKGLEERLSASRFLSRDRTSLRDRLDLEIRCDVAQEVGRTVIFLRIEDARDGRTLFSGHRSVEGGASEAISADSIAGLVHSAATKVTHRLPDVLDPSRPEVAALGLSNLGLQKLADFDPSGFEDAHAHFRQAHDADANGVYLAWRAFVRMAQLVEKAEGDQQAWLDEIQQIGPEALGSASDNGLAIALVALTRIMLEDDLTAPAELAKKAMSWNENNLFAQQTLAVAHSAVGDAAKAYELSTACRRSAPADELGHLWDLYHALVCISAGRLDEARAAAERASAKAPKFVAPKRQLVALCAHAGDITAAQAYLDDLRKIERDFSLDRYLNDPNYPVLTLRKAGLITPLRGSLDDG